MSHWLDDLTAAQDEAFLSAAREARWLGLIEVADALLAQRSDLALAIHNLKAEERTTARLLKISAEKIAQAQAQARAERIAADQAAQAAKPAPSVGKVALALGSLWSDGKAAKPGRKKGGNR